MPALEYLLSLCPKSTGKEITSPFQASTAVSTQGCFLSIQVSQTLLNLAFSTVVNPNPISSALQQFYLRTILISLYFSRSFMNHQNPSNSSNSSGCSAHTKAHSFSARYLIDKILLLSVSKDMKFWQLFSVSNPSKQSGTICRVEQGRINRIPLQFDQIISLQFWIAYTKYQISSDSSMVWRSSSSSLAVIDGCLKMKEQSTQPFSCCSIIAKSQRLRHRLSGLKSSSSCLISCLLWRSSSSSPMLCILQLLPSEQSQ